MKMSNQNAKSALFELVAQLSLPAPHFETVGTNTAVKGQSGFTSAVTITLQEGGCPRVFSSDVHSRKKDAEKEAALIALESLRSQSPESSDMTKVLRPVIVAISTMDTALETLPLSLRFFDSYDASVLLLFSAVTSFNQRNEENARRDPIRSLTFLREILVEHQSFFCSHFGHSLGNKVTVEGETVRIRGPTNAPPTGADATMPTHAPIAGRVTFLRICSDGAKEREVDLSETAGAAPLFLHRAICSELDAESLWCKTVYLRPLGSYGAGLSQKRAMSGVLPTDSDGLKIFGVQRSSKKAAEHEELNPVASWLAGIPVFGSVVMADVSPYRCVGVDESLLQRVIRSSLPSGQCFSKEVDPCGVFLTSLPLGYDSSLCSAVDGACAPMQKTPLVALREYIKRLTGQDVGLSVCEPPVAERGSAAGAEEAAGWVEPMPDHAWWSDATNYVSSTKTANEPMASTTEASPPGTLCSCGDGYSDAASLRSKQESGGATSEDRLGRVCITLPDMPLEGLRALSRKQFRCDFLPSQACSRVRPADVMCANDGAEATQTAALWALTEIERAGRDFLKIEQQEPSRVYVGRGARSACLEDCCEEQGGEMNDDDPRQEMATLILEYPNREPIHFNTIWDIGMNNPMFEKFLRVDNETEKTFLVRFPRFASILTPRAEMMTIEPADQNEASLRCQDDSEDTTAVLVKIIRIIDLSSARKPGSERKRAADADRGLFRPKLSTQRQRLLAAILRKSRTESWLDLGAGNGKFVADVMSLLKGNTASSPLTVIGCLDINPVRVRESEKNLMSKFDGDASSKEIFCSHGNLLETKTLEGLRRTGGWGVISLVEVIEHLASPDVASEVVVNCLQILKPEYLFLSTPNYDANKSIQMAVFNEGLATEGMFREKDHKFEFSRAEFLCWNRKILETVGNQYEVATHGIGKYIFANTEPAIYFFNMDGSTQTATYRRVR